MRLHSLSVEVHNKFERSQFDEQSETCRVRAFLKPCTDRPGRTTDTLLLLEKREPSGGRLGDDV